MARRRGIAGLAAVAVALMGATVVSSTAHHRQAEGDDRDTQLSHDVAQRATALDNYFERARAVNLVLAENPAFRGYYESASAKTSGDGHPGHDHGSAHATDGHLHQAQEALAQLQEVFPTSIGEACFIDLGGAELARVVRGETAAADDLSPDESGAVFFEPTASSQPGEVHQAVPYLSPDTGEWVVSNSTLVETADGAKGMVHFEVTVESFRAETLAVTDARAVVIDVTTGRIVIDTDNPVTNPDELGPLAPSELLSAAERVTDSTEHLTIDGVRYALQRISAADDPSNSNSWVVGVAVAEAVPFGVTFGPMEAGLLVLLALVLGLITSRIRARQATLMHLAGTDPLTDLANRRAFSEAVEEMLESGDPFSIAMFDLNRFKEVNDGLGHDAGDEVLRQVAGRITEHVRDVDLVSRLGGDEFAVLIHGDEDPAVIARRIVDSVSEPFQIECGTVVIGCSAGTAQSPHDGIVGADLLRFADLAMYRAKRMSADVVAFCEDFDPDSPRRLAMAAALRTAIQDRAIDVAYQPQIDAVTGETTSVEALARWNDPELGPVSPADFIPLAEDLGLIGKLTELILDKALDVVASDLRATGMEMAVNLSPRLLFDDGIVDTVGRALAERNIGAGRLKLEITEGLLVGDSPQELSTLHQLRHLGCKLSLDDFGTGHSSLSYLSRLPVDELKIDRSFVMGMREDPSNGFIIRSAIDLAHHLGLDVVAEGVEDAQALETLASMGCDEAQGFHIARPMPATDLVEWVSNRRQLQSI